MNTSTNTSPGSNTSPGTTIAMASSANHTTNNQCQDTTVNVQGTTTNDLLWTKPRTTAEWTQALAMEKAARLRAESEVRQLEKDLRITEKDYESAMAELMEMRDRYWDYVEATKRKDSVDAAEIFYGKHERNE